MIYAILNGRLGNNLFQIATCASLAAKNNTEYCIFPGEYITPPPENLSLVDYVRKFDTTILRKVPVTPKRPDFSTLYQEKNFQYEDIPFEENMMIDGFFQSEKYFVPEVVRDLYEIDPVTKAYIEDKYRHLFKEEITALHVRRGDYFGNVDNHPICTLDYFRSAIKHIGKDKRFLVFSDDIAWCKKKFRGENFFFAENETAIVDIYLQSYCTNNIISNSSFSWWGAWLNSNPDKTVIAPDPWFGVAYQYKNTKDLLPENWIRLSNKMPLYLRTYGYYLWYDKRIRYFIDTKIKKKK
jgi:Glycosyl transferase family 11.